MADVVQKAKLKSPYTDRLNPRYAVSVNAEQKRRQAEAFEASTSLFGGTAAGSRRHRATRRCASRLRRIPRPS
jgi:hypothetical protein